MFDLYKNLDRPRNTNGSQFEEELSEILIELENSLIKKVVNKIIVKEFGKEMPLLADKVSKNLPSNRDKVAFQ